MGRIFLILGLSFGMVAGFGHGIARVAGWRGHGPCAAYRGHHGWKHHVARRTADQDCPCLRDRQPPAAAGPASPTPPKK